MPVDSSEDIFANSRKTMVFYKVGRFDDKSNQLKMVKAPFDIVNMSSNPTAARTAYIEPNGFDVSGVYQTSNAGYELLQSRTGMAWYSGNTFVMEQHELGDLSDNWRGLCYFSYL